MDDAVRRQALGAAAADRMRREFSLARAVEKMQEIYETVLPRMWILTRLNGMDAAAKPVLEVLFRLLG